MKLQSRWPAVFTDLCFYSEVSHLLGVYSFRLASRRFIQELFLQVDFARYAGRRFQTAWSSG